MLLPPGWNERMQYLQRARACQPTLRFKVDERLRRFADALWPPVCVLCGDRGQRGLDLCAECDAELPRIGACCPACALPLPETAAGSICGACLRRRSAVHATSIPFRYAYPIDHLIHAFKYGAQAQYGRVLGLLLARHLCAEERRVWPELVLPMPLAPRRYRERGFNQATELASCLSHIEGLRVRTDVAERARETLEQASLDRKARRRNVRRAFRLVQSLQASHVAVIDDVVTTGSTVNELAKLLRRANAQRVDVWAIARVSGK